MKSPSPQSDALARLARAVQLYLVPSGSLRSKEVLRGMAAWACWSSCWHCSRSGVPGTGEALDKGCRAGVGTRCHVVSLRKGVLYSQGVPSLSSLYSTMGIRQSSEHPLWSEKSGERRLRAMGTADSWPRGPTRAATGGRASPSKKPVACIKCHVTLHFLSCHQSLS